MEVDFKEKFETRGSKDWEIIVEMFSYDSLIV